MITRFTPELKAMTVAYIQSLHKAARVFQNFAFSADRVAEYYDFCMTPMGFGAVDIVDTKITGILAAYAAPIICSNDLYSQDFVLWVNPGHANRTKVAKQLVVTYIEWARALDVKSINLGITLGIEDKGAAALYKHLGFKPVAHTYSLEASQ